MSQIFDLLISLFCIWFGTCADNGCREMKHANGDYIVCTYAAENVTTRLYLNDTSGRPFERLSALERTLSTAPLMLMNGGMYHEDLDAVGLYIEDGRQHKNISTKGGWGNFHLLPNGVFWGKDGKLAVSETKSYMAKNVKPDFATQSGPMLVIEGQLHPRFLKDSDSRKIRNGVGVSADGKTVHFAISKGAVTFWDFGTLFKDELKSKNALFLDGTVSAIRTPRFKRGGWRALGPMIGVFAR